MRRSAGTRAMNGTRHSPLARAAVALAPASRKAARKTRPARRIARTIRVVRRAVLRSLYGQRRRTF
ncbi:hypothetical protein BUH_0660 [Burkholderia pseudomallei Pakistan 9]|nr:hypothetical protein BUH_0660 [Burkholderia pseudomallei Pakistan 9]